MALSQTNCHLADRFREFQRASAAEIGRREQKPIWPDKPINTLIFTLAGAGLVVVVIVLGALSRI